MKRHRIYTSNLKPRNEWQKTYEVLVKINMLRKKHNFSRLEPIGIEAIEDLHPEMVYEMNARILTELEIFEMRKDIEVPNFKVKTFNNKTSIDNYNAYIDISIALEHLNQRALTPSYVYAEAMRIYDDITILLNHLDIHDTTLPEKKVPHAIPRDAMNTSIKLLNALKTLQQKVGIKTTDFSEFKKQSVRPSDVYTMTGFIIAELQTVKAYVGLTRSVTPPALNYKRKKPADVEQLMRWNYKRLKLIKDLHRRGE